LSQQLRSNALGLVETVGQSLAAIAPTLTPALNITVVAGLAGIGCWLSYLIGTVGVVIVAANVGVLAARHREAGSYFIYIGRTLGALAGALAGWAMISAYLLTAVAVSLSFAIFLGNFCAEVGLHAGLASSAVALLLFVGAMTWSAYRDVKLSSRGGLLLEIISIGIIVLITVLFVSKQGTMIDRAQLKIFNFNYGAVFSALPFVIFSFVGFESAATLAKETTHPQRDIPLAVMGCGGFAGIFFTVMAYFMVFGMADDAASLGTSSAPFTAVAARAGLRSASLLVYCAAMASVFACGLASINAAARLLFSMGKYQFLHRSLGDVHPSHRTPHRAILACGLIVVVICFALLPLGLLNAFGYAGTLASFGFVAVYLLVCVVAPLDLQRSGQMKARHVLIGVLGAALMCFVIFGSLYPVPPHPYDVLPFVFFGYLLVGGVWFGMLKLRAPQVLASIRYDMEDAA
jgi:amino acid transporter